MFYNQQKLFMITELSCTYTVFFYSILLVNFFHTVHRNVDSDWGLFIKTLLSQQ